MSIGNGSRRSNGFDELLGHRETFHDNGQKLGAFPGSSIRTAGGPDTSLDAGFSPRATRTYQWARPERVTDGFIYNFGTTSANVAVATSLSRSTDQLPGSDPVPIWNGDKRRTLGPANPGAATPLCPVPVGEMSAQYNSYLQQYWCCTPMGAATT